MGFFNEFPHTRTYDNDLGWLIKTIKDLEANLENFIKLNTVKYADPIQWNISTQYEANTVVIDELTGVAYISTQPVPSGVNINNTDYWTPVFTLDIVNLNKNITLRNDGDNHNATFESVVGDWVIVGGQLYRVTQDIGIHTAYVVGFNIEIYTVELFVKDYLNQVLTLIGDLQELNTSDKTSIVNAINSILDTIGDLEDLDTEDKTSVVNAINELKTNIHDTIGDLHELDTEDKTSVVNAINELKTNIDNTNNVIDDITDEFGFVAYKIASECEGDSDTAKLQYALDNYDFVILDRDYAITEVAITRSVKFNLGGHKITSVTEDKNTIDIIANNVEIFNGEIYTTVNNPVNTNQFGSCLYTLNKPTYNPSGKLYGLSLHHLKLSSNAAQTIVLLGEVYNSEIFNIIFDGDRINVSNELDAINIEWSRDENSIAVHPHDIVIKNFTILNYKISNHTGIGIRTAGAFNLTIENVYAYNCDYVIDLTSGDFGGSLAPDSYKKLVNTNIVITNVGAVNCNIAIGAFGITTYPYGTIQFSSKNVFLTSTVRQTAGAIGSSNIRDCSFENIRVTGEYLEPILIRGDRCKLTSALVSGAGKWGLYVDGKRNTVEGCVIENANQDNATGVTGFAMLVIGEENKVHDCITSCGSDDHTVGGIRCSANHSIITDNTCYKYTITDVSTGSIVDNNITELT